MTKPTKSPLDRSRVIRLARMIRDAGWQSLGQSELEVRLGRKLTTAERRAFLMAIDSAANPDGSKGAYANREDRIAAGESVKHAVVRGFRDNQSSPKRHRTGGMRPLPKGEYLPQGDFTGKAPERAHTRKAFDGNGKVSREHVLELSGMKSYAVLQEHISGQRVKRSRILLNVPKDSE